MEQASAASPTGHGRLQSWRKHRGVMVAESEMQVETMEDVVRMSRELIAPVEVHRFHWNWYGCA